MVSRLQVASSAIATMPSILFFPLLTFTMFLALFIYWIIVFAYQWSAGTIVPIIDETRDAATQYTLSWMFNAEATNSTLPADSELFAADVDMSVAGMACYDDPNCYYSVEFSQQQQVRHAAPLQLHGSVTMHATPRNMETLCFVLQRLLNKLEAF